MLSLSRRTVRQAEQIFYPVSRGRGWLYGSEFLNKEDCGFSDQIEVCHT